MLLLNGAPGVGKTATAQILAARRDRSAHVKADLFFDFIESGFVEPWKPESREQNPVVMRAIADAAAAYAAGGYFTVVDGIILPGWFLEPLRDSLSDAGHPVAYAVLEGAAGRLRRQGGQPRHPTARRPPGRRTPVAGLRGLGRSRETRSTSARAARTKPPTCWSNGCETARSPSERELKGCGVYRPHNPSIVAPPGGRAAS